MTTLLVLLGLLLLPAPGPATGSLAAQEAGRRGEAADTAGAGGARASAVGGQASDTTQQVDSTRVRIFEQLEALGRPPGVDSSRLARDSAALAERTGRGGGQGGRGGAGGEGVGVQDSLSRALRELEGYAPTSYSGTSAAFETRNRRLVLRGSGEERPQVSRQGMLLSADSAIVYEEGAERVRAVGNAQYTPERGDPVDSESMILDLSSQRASALGARTRYAQGGTEWIVTGDLPSVASEVVYGSHTSFTSCELEKPHYHFETDEIKIHAGNILVARPVRLYFSDVPVAWLPFIAQSLEQGRSSGLLTPRFSVNDIVRTSQGYNRRISNVGFYWAVNQYADATVALDWFSDRFTAVTGGVNYRWRRQFLNGSANVRRYWSADGGTELAFDTRHRWDYSERTKLSVEARYASSSDFVRRNSFDPREVTRSIRSQGGLNHRFDWGSLNVGANRQQFLSDDRVEMTLPSVSLNLNPITFLQAPPSQASFYNNVTWNGSVSATRSLQDFPDQPVDSTFEASRLDRASTRAGINSSWTLGNVSLSQSANYDASTRKGIPDFLLSPGDGSGTSEQSVAARLAAGLPAQEVERVDVTGEELSWSASASYQQRLIGSTTLTPRLSVNGRSIRSDTLSAGSGFVSAPTRVSFGGRLKTDVFGFYPGVGSFDRIRHKMSPSFSYDYSPEVQPTQLQQDVFGSREIQTKSVVSIDLNQTFEASVEQEDEERDSDPAAREAAAADTAQSGSTAGEQDAGQAGRSRERGSGRGGGGSGPWDESGLERLETGRKVTLLGLQTSVVTYDFVQADSAGNFLGGFTTTTLSNSVRSDYLQGLSLQFRHDLFRTETGTGGAGGVGGGTGGNAGSGRVFDPHLSSMNLSFSLNSSSTIFEWLGLTGGGDGESQGGSQAPAGQTGEPDDDPFGAEGSDETSIVPGAGGQGGGGRRRGGSGGVGQWNANLSYSLQRPRTSSSSGNQMLQATLNFQPTERWDVNWRTSYDINRGTFNDHMIRLTRDLHRWEANFDFRKTATGNWSFRFEVRLLDNQDLKFDYEQRSRLER